MFFTCFGISLFRTKPFDEFVELVELIGELLEELRIPQGMITK